MSTGRSIAVLIEILVETLCLLAVFIGIPFALWLAASAAGLVK